MGGVDTKGISQRVFWVLVLDRRSLGEQMNFAIIGAGGYIAPRHMKAIQSTGNNIVAAVDPHDSVGILDSFDYHIQYFNEIERFERYLFKLSKKPDRIHYVSVCSPNYLHDTHCRIALNNEADAICEKPLVINPWNLDMLEKCEMDNGQHVYPIMQMRYYPEVLELKRTLNSSYHKVRMIYNTPRGMWYYHSWKGDKDKSGGLLMNIGIHMFDLLLWIFGNPCDTETKLLTEHSATGGIWFDRAEVQWNISIDTKDADKVERKIIVDNRSIDFSDANNLDLHTIAYQEILKGRGFGIEDARPAIEFVRRLKFGQYS